MVNSPSYSAAAPGQYSKVQRAAVVLLALGEESAVEVLKNLYSEEIQKLATAIPTVRDIPVEVTYEILDKFCADLKSPVGLGFTADEFVREVMIKALGEERAQGLMDRIELNRSTAGLDPLKWMEPRAVADLIRVEHPQIKAIILSHLEADQAAAVIKFLDPVDRSDVMLRVANLDGIPPNALNELNEVLQRQFNGSEALRSSSIGGVKVAAGILNLMDSGQEEDILGHIEEQDPELCISIRELMFVFDNLLDLDSRTIQMILREVSNDRLGLALRGADDKVRNHIVSNMSQRAGQILIEDMAARGPVRLTEVEAAQKEILAVVRRLADEGTIQLMAKQETFV